MKVIRNSGMVTLHQEQIINCSKKELWQFISNAKNLSKITPKELNFKITNESLLNDNFYPGMLITYKVSPMFNIPVNWVTEITQVKEGAFFIDNQKSGPYAIWHHQHFIQELEDGRCKMIDIVAFKGPLGILGNWLIHPFLTLKVKEIFKYRSEIMKKLFP